MLGRTFKGLTDAMLEWQTAELPARAIGREDDVVHGRPGLGVGIACIALRRSRRNPRGLALRVVRAGRRRDDQTAAQVDMPQNVGAICRARFAGCAW